VSPSFTPSRSPARPVPDPPPSPAPLSPSHPICTALSAKTYAIPLGGIWYLSISRKHENTTQKKVEKKKKGIGR